MSAGTRGHRVPDTADVGDPLAPQNQHHLVVRVTVVGRSPWRDLADELRRYGTVTAGAEQHAELPVTRGLDLAVTEVAAERREGRRVMAVRAGKRHDVQSQTQPIACARLVGAARRQQHSAVSTERDAGVARHRELARPLDYETNLHRWCRPAAKTCWGRNR